MAHQLIDDMNGASKFPGWSARLLPGKKLYRPLAVNLEAYRVSAVQVVVAELERLKDMPDDSAKVTSGDRVKVLIGDLPMCDRESLTAIVDVVVGTGRLASDAFGMLKTGAESKGNEQRKVTHAIAILETAVRSGDKRVIAHFGSDFLQQVVTRAKSVMTSHAQSEVAKLEASLRSSITAAEELVDKIPDPQEYEKKFLAFMRSSGGRMNSMMKEVLYPPMLMSSVVS